MAKKILSFLFFVGIGFSCIQGQTTNVKDHTKAFKTYFELPRETTFLHSNKSAYVVGEEIWFKGYVYNRQKGKPFKETSNIYIGIYDSIGRPLSKKLFRSKEGFFNGNIKVDSTYSTGSYYIKVYTNWMKNFIEEDAYVQKIQIYDKSETRTNVQDEVSYDVQFLPEGGNIVQGIPNTIGVKVTDQYGYGKKIKEGIILNQEETIVKQFRNNDMGLGKFKMVPYPGEEYKARITFADGSQEIYALPKIYTEGITINLQNTAKDRLTLIINTNAETREKIGNRKFELFIHRDGAFRKLPIDFPKDRTNVSLLLKKEILHKGMNIITLFDDTSTPVLERLFFNSYGMDFPDATISSKKVAQDSLEVRFKIASESTDLKSLSVSVLPKNTIAYRHKDNILSAFYLKPYLRGLVEKPTQYFKDFDAKKEAQLDLLLLTQGWSRYQWTDILNNPTEEAYSFEQGVRFDGVIKSKVRNGEKVFLKGTRNHTSQYLKIDDNKFTVVNYFPEKGESVRIALNKKYGGYRKPDLDMDMDINMKMDTLSYVWTDDTSLQVANYDIPDSFSFVLEDNTIELNEVTVVEKKKNVLSQTNVFVPQFLKNKVTEVTPEIAWNRPLFSDILRANGYQVRESLQFSAFDPQDPQSGSDANSRVDIRVRTKQSFSNAKSPQPIIYLNGVRLTLFDELYRFPTSKIESYYFERSGASEGSRGAGGVIRIFTRRDSEVTSVFAEDDEARRFGDVAEGKYYEFKVSDGFETEKEFYTPKYNTYKNEAFESFGVIHWAPQIITNKQGEASFKILDTGIKDLSFFIEGMGKDGSLLSVTKHIKIMP